MSVLPAHLAPTVATVPVAKAVTVGRAVTVATAPVVKAATVARAAIKNDHPS